MLFAVANHSVSKGITASHSLSFEPKAPTHAKFDKSIAANRWTISSRTLRQLMDHFGPGIELLDINTDEENHVVNFTCFTEKPQKRNANIDEGNVGSSSTTTRRLLIGLHSCPQEAPPH